MPPAKGSPSVAHPIGNTSEDLDPTQEIKKKMRVLVATTYAVPHEGGLSTHVEALCRALKSLGHEVMLLEGRQVRLPLTARLWRRLRRRLRRDTPAMLVADQRKKIAKLRTIGQRMCAAFKPDVVHCHDPFVATALLRATGGDVPLIETVHGPALYEMQMICGEGPEEFYDEIRQIEREALAGASFLLPVDTGQATILQQEYGIPASKMEVVYNCVDVDEVRELCQPNPEWSIPAPYFLVPRRLVPKTGVRYAIEAMQFVGSSSVRLVVAGDGVLRQELQAYARQLGLHDRVLFLGSVPRHKLMPLFSRAVAVLVPSVPAAGVVEATSLAVTEAMAAGTVPIASAIGGLAELIDDGKTGLLVPPGDAHAIADAMRRVMDRKHREELVQRASEVVERQYSIPSWINRIESHYKRFAPVS